MRYLKDFQKAACTLSNLFPPNSVVGEADFDILSATQTDPDNWRNFHRIIRHYVSRDFSLYQYYFQYDVDRIAKEAFRIGSKFRYQVLPSYESEWFEWVATLTVVGDARLRIPVRIGVSDYCGMVCTLMEIALVVVDRE